jgi:hypothetical protein
MRTPAKILCATLIASISHAAVAQARNNPACIDVEVNGRHTLAYDCLSQLMVPANAPAAAPATIGDPRANPSNTSGQFNLSAFKHRMGSNLGVSVQPFRPSLTYPTPLAAPAK